MTVSSVSGKHVFPLSPQRIENVFTDPSRNNTLKEAQVILTFATVAKNSDLRPQWKSMRKDILNDVEHIGIDQIFTDYPIGSKEKCQKWQKYMPFVYFLLGNL